ATIALCNNADLVRKEGAWKVTGDPTEGALLTLAAKGGVPKDSVVSSVEVVKELPFDSDRKRMTILALDEHGNEVVHTKGSADVLLPLCDSYACDGGDEALSEEMRDTFMREVERMSEQSLRVLAVARRVLEKSDAPSSGSGDRKSIELEEKLTFVGLT